jgi:hypothetical protein
MSLIRPEVGLAMHPIKLKRVVLPDPLGPIRTITLSELRLRLTPLMATNSFGLPWLKTFLTLINSIMLLTNVNWVT